MRGSTRMTSTATVQSFNTLLCTFPLPQDHIQKIIQKKSIQLLFDGLLQLIYQFFRTLCICVGFSGDCPSEGYIAPRLGFESRFSVKNASLTGFSYLLPVCPALCLFFLHQLMQPLSSFGCRREMVLPARLNSIFSCV